MIDETYQGLLRPLAATCRQVYGGRLIALVVFGSVGRRTARPGSDLDLFLVVEDLPRGRRARLAEFEAVEQAMAPQLSAAARLLGAPVELSPVIRSPAELAYSSPLLLDMIDDGRVLVDHDGVFAAALSQLQARLTELGARRIWRGNAWFWDLKPDYQPGETFAL